MTGNSSQDKQLELKRLPKFKSLEEEAAFWDTHSFADYLDEFEEVKDPVFVEPRKQVVSLRLDQETVTLLKRLAEEKGLPYTTLVRMWVKEHLHEELAARRPEAK